MEKYWPVLFAEHVTTQDVGNIMLNLAARAPLEIAAEIAQKRKLEPGYLIEERGYDSGSDTSMSDLDLFGGLFDEWD